VIDAQLKSPLFDCLVKLKELASHVRTGAYAVRRGATTWATFPFDTFPRAISIMCDECQPVPVNDQTSATVTLEMFMKLDPALQEQGLDDDTMDEMRADARQILEQLQEAKNVDNDSIIIHISLNKERAKAIETHDAQLSVQGLIVTFDIIV
jgi:hypothetical protein